MDERNAVIAAGLQDGSLVFLHAVDEGLQLIRTILVPKTPVDRAILRLRVNPMNHCQLAVAGSDGKLRLLMLNVTVKQ
ncbi:hypothetical protein KIN20_004020 [Parelaphostrongylus tenuis]|uniref:Uncharacterized protein n=1 Tax=Parelaphostrongylus tenuis TaxID=148309 RepID=A0AAD5M148_PARTN|nr:hypothetical protein KIN20_004020 [Parelaphostrongylus tenuis]